MAIVTRIDPLAYGVDALRTLLLGQSHFGLPLDIAVLSAGAFVLILAGSHAFRRMQV
jgi:ABC-type polysaccharide/polyol phosphate export permease